MNSDSKRLVELLLKIPMQDKYELIGNEVSTSIESYCRLHPTLNENEIDVEEIVIYHYGREILLNKHNKVLKNIILFIK